LDFAVAALNVKGKEMKITKTSILATFLVFVCGMYSLAADELVLHLSFDEGSGNIASDSSAFGNDCSLIGNPQWSDGPFGTALELDGASWGEVADADSLDIADAITMEMWAKIPVGGEPLQSGAEKGASWIPGLYNLSPLYNGGTILQFSDLPADCTDLNVGASIQDGEWHFLAGTWDGATIRLYIDGDADASLNCEGTLTPNDAPLFIGARGGTVRFVTGELDEIKIYNYALSEAEIQADMDSPADSSAVEPGGKLAVTWGRMKSHK